MESDVRGAKQAAGKQNLQYASYGCNYTRTTGIWQTVWMEAVHPEGLQSVQLLTDIDQQQLVVRPRFYHEAGGKLQVTLKDNGKVVASRTVSASSLSSVVLPVKKMQTWSPESPFLYDLEYKVLDKNGNIIGLLYTSSYPLISVDPYTSVWSFADELNADVTRHWTGKEQALLGVVDVDGVSYRFMGKETPEEGASVRFATAARQLSVNVLPTQTYYTFECLSLIHIYVPMFR